MSHCGYITHSKWTLALLFRKDSLMGRVENLPLRISSLLNLLLKFDMALHRKVMSDVQLTESAMSLTASNGYLPRFLAFFMAAVLIGVKNWLPAHFILARGRGLGLVLKMMASFRPP
jgi:hypothetical protein